VVERKKDQRSVKLTTATRDPKVRKKEARKERRKTRRRKENYWTFVHSPCN